MPGIEHEAVVELLHRNPHLVAALLTACGVPVAADATAAIADSNLSARKPVTLTAEIVVKLTAPGQAERVVVFEVQKDPPKPSKRRAWAAYVPIAGVQHKCNAFLIIIALRAETARASRKLIRTGHPGYDLTPIVIGPDNTPDPASPRHEQAVVELTVLAALTGALDLGDDQVQDFVLETLARTDPDRRAAYTGLILTIASEAAQKALEDLMRTARRDNLADRLLAEGRTEGLVEGRTEGLAEGLAEGRAAMLLRILQARGLTVPDDVREQITSCTDAAQLDEWAVLAVTARSISEIF
jgi:hypothetical protein